MMHIRVLHSCHVSTFLVVLKIESFIFRWTATTVRLFTADCSAAATIGALSAIQAQGGNMPVSLSVRKQFLGKLANPIHIMLKHVETPEHETPKMK